VCGARASVCFGTSHGLHTLMGTVHDVWLELGLGLVGEQEHVLCLRCC